MLQKWSAARMLLYSQSVHWFEIPVSPHADNPFIFYEFVFLLSRCPGQHCATRAFSVHPRRAEAPMVSLLIRYVFASNQCQLLPSVCNFHPDRTFCICDKHVTRNTSFQKGRLFFHCHVVPAGSKAIRTFIAVAQNSTKRFSPIQLTRVQAGFKTKYPE